MRCDDLGWRWGSPLLVAVATLLLAGSGLLAVAQADPAAPDVAHAVRTPRPPVMDGRLDESFWEEAKPNGGFFLFKGEGRRVTDTTFRLAFDDAWLYLGVDCLNKDLRGVPPRVRGHDKQANADDSVELFMAPGTEGGTYFHYMCSYGGAKDERRISGSRRELEWDMPWRTAMDVREDGWSAEVAIPLCIIAAYEQPSRMTINVMRNRRIVTTDTQNVVVDDVMELSSWAPVSSSFHETNRFRPVAGLPDRMKVQTPLLARISDAKVKPYYFKDERAYYDVDLEVTGFTRQRGELAVGVLDHPTDGKESATEETVQVDGTAKRRVRIAVPVAALAARKVAVTLKDPARNEVLEITPVEDVSALDTMSAYLDRNYYTSEPNAAAICRVGLPDEALKGVSLEARTGDGRVLGKLAAATRENRLAIPLNRLPLGVNTVDVVLCGKDKTSLFTVSLKLVKRAPKPSLEWKIDRERRAVLNNGKPFVPFGVIMSGVKADDLGAYKKLTDHNFNTFLVWSYTTPEEIVLFNKNAAARGLYVISHPDTCGAPIEWDAYARYSGTTLERLKWITQGARSMGSIRGIVRIPLSVAESNAIYGEFYTKNLSRFVQAVNNVETCENLAGYFIMDEPLPQRLLDECKFGQDFYARIHEADGYHPIMVNYSSFIPEGDQYVNWCDILVTDPYWIPPAREGTHSTPNHVSKITWTTNQRALAHRQAVWQILTGSRWSNCRKRPLTRMEIRSQTYLALIHKATGVFYFAYSNIVPAAWDMMKVLGEEMKVLTPFVGGPEVAQEIAYRRAVLAKAGDKPDFKDNPFNPTKEAYPDVQTVVLTDAGGNAMLLAANSRHYPVACRFQMPALKSAAVQFGSPAPTVRDGEVADTIEPYGTRAWRIELAPHAAPLSVTLLQTVLKEDLPNRETSLAHEYRPGKKNVLPNPSFEDTSAEDWIDYCTLSDGGRLQDGGALYGKRCARMDNTGERTIEYLHVFCNPQEDKPTTYTFSVYLKGSENRLRAWIRGTQMNREKKHGENVSIELTTEWKRYSISGVIPARVDDAVYEVRLNGRGTMWVDGTQLERGDKPTEYEE